MNLSGLGQGQVAGPCKGGNDHSGSITCGGLLNQLKNG